MDINSMSQEDIKELRMKLDNRESEIEEEKRKLKVEKAKKKLDRIIATGLIDLIEHSRTSCSDLDPSNGYNSSVGYARCNKCHLLEIIEDHENGINEFEVLIDIATAKI